MSMLKDTSFRLKMIFFFYKLEYEQTENAEP